ncbi:type VI secretion system Vgr family protein [Pseudoduganella ginsengisoli]|uniref:type VI secretion system Vgr family protein n=1 Tax=Pseudoduganella ginsengisoli TaxID=1462440 RepID=UPI001E5445F3|nr:type VI secretion system Vgr family protein [Pseudoduganella ginsengisoli]
MDGARTWIQSVLDSESQHGRLLTMAFPRGDGPEYAVLLVNTLHAREELSRSFRYEVELLSDDAHIALTDMMAKLVTISLVRNDGSQRYFNGYVTEFSLLGADGGQATYRMVLEPWMALTRLRQDCVSFHGRTVAQITELTLRHCVQHDWKTRLTRDDPPITCAIQYNETDYNHLHRRWEALGWHYWYEHRADGHTLWLADDTMGAAAIDAREGTFAADGMPFRSEAGSQEDDSIHQWQAMRRLGASVLTLSTFDYKSPSPRHISARTRYPQGDRFDHEVHEYAGANAYHGSREGEPLAQRRSDGREALYQYFEASGNDRSAQPGRYFRLEEHFSAEAPLAEIGDPSREGRCYLILSVEHTATNNYQDGRHAESKYTNRFTCIRQQRRWYPERGYHSTPCPDPGVQTAIVAGPAGEEIHTDALGRIKVQFHWDRLGKGTGGNSPWVRVAMPVAGAGFGQIGLPRVGQEVVVQFVNGNVDHPIVTGVVYNGANAVPWALPEQRALSGWRSRELGGQRGNQLVMDDTRDQLQAQLRSDHLHSQLGLGHIVRVESVSGRGEARGDGFELRTDGHGVVRAGRGMLVTTEERAGARSHITSMEETAMRLDRAQASHASLAELAQPHDGDAARRQADVIKALETQQHAVTGKDAKALASHLVFASPAGIASSTAGSTHIASDQHTALSCGKSLSLSSGESLFATVKRSLRLFVQQAGMKLVAAAGDIDIQALSDNIRLLSKLEISQTANRILITAKEEVVIDGGGSYLRFSADGIEQGTNGNYVAHAAKHSFVGPKNRDVDLVMPPLSKLKGKGVPHLGSHPAASGRACKGWPCKLFKDGALLEETKLDEEGTLQFKHDLDEESIYHLELPGGQRYEITPDDMQEPHTMNTAIGYHGYCNPGGSIVEDSPSEEQERLDANPLTRGAEDHGR